MAVVLAATGAFLYLRLESELESQIDQTLRTRADDVVAALERGRRLSDTLPRLTDADESVVQVIGPDGRVVDATPGAGGPALLGDAELARARAATIVVEGDDLPELDDPARLLATPLVASGERLVVVVGTSIDDQEAALAGLRTQLLIGGPLALLLASGIGYLLAAAALRPVESMRRRAAAISASAVGQQLPVPPARDEIGRLGETLNEMLARLEDALARERRFVADASHELRTPLALMKTELELALRRPRSQAELEAALRSAAEETDRLARLAEDLLVIARSDRGELPIRVEDVAVGELLATVAGRFASRGEVDASPSALVVRGDRLRLEQALGNVVENALRYGKGPVRLRAAERDGLVELHATDEGPGFPPAFLPYAFERFSRVDEARARGGAGLGLAIVDAVARAHGGSAHAANRNGGGADVWLALPAPALSGGRSRLPS